jgi:hypothetical protein
LEAGIGAKLIELRTYLDVDEHRIAIFTGDLQGLDGKIDLAETLMDHSGSEQWDVTCLCKFLQLMERLPSPPVIDGMVDLPTGPVPIAAAGRANLKADGTVSGTEARSVGDGNSQRIQVQATALCLCFTRG